MIGYGDKVRWKLDVAAGIDRVGRVVRNLPDGNLLVDWGDKHEEDHTPDSLALAYPDTPSTQAFIFRPPIHTLPSHADVTDIEVRVIRAHPTGHVEITQKTEHGTNVMEVDARNVRPA